MYIILNKYTNCVLFANYFSIIFEKHFRYLRILLSNI